MAAVAVDTLLLVVLAAVAVALDRKRTCSRWLFHQESRLCTLRSAQVEQAAPLAQTDRPVPKPTCGWVAKPETRCCVCVAVISAELAGPQTGAQQGKTCSGSCFPGRVALALGTGQTAQTGCLSTSRNPVSSAQAAQVVEALALPHQQAAVVAVPSRATTATEELELVQVVQVDTPVSSGVLTPLDLRSGVRL